MKHVGSYVVKLPIAFPCFITGINLKQHPNIMHTKESLNKKVGPLTLDYKLFVRTHVPYIVVSRNQDKAADGNSSPLSKSTKMDIMLELKEVSKALEETIWSSTLREKNVDRLIKIIPKEDDVVEEEEAGNVESLSEEESSFEDWHHQIEVVCASSEESCFKEWWYDVFWPLYMGMFLCGYVLIL